MKKGAEPDLKMAGGSSPGGPKLKDPPANAGATRQEFPSLGGEDPLEEEMATHCSILARLSTDAQRIIRDHPFSPTACSNRVWKSRD